MFDKSTALVILQGINSSIIALSYSDELLDILLQGFLIGSMAPEEKDTLQADLLAEASNIIVGNSLKSLGIWEDQLTVSTPVIECSKSSILRHSRSQILCRELEEGCYTLTISLVSMDEELVEEGIILDRDADI
ncbi:chemotaxis protein CheX [Syntrophomonas curvata]